MEYAQRLERLAAAGLPIDAPRLEALAANSEALVRALCRHPEDYARIDAPIDAAALSAELAELMGAAPDEAHARWALRRLKARAFLRLTDMELSGGARVDEVCRGLTTLAEVCLEAAVAFAHQTSRHPRPFDKEGAPIPFVVLGMGKLGGWELNYSSDIDVIYFYGTDEAQGGEDAHGYFRRLCQKITALLSEITEEGFVFRVDLRLRPEGRSGPLCNALSSAERYYETWGRLWERLAFLRARPVAGDLWLGERLLERLRPWIYPRSVGPTLVEDFAQLRAQAIRPRDVLDLKLSPGGIRGVEFFVHLYQLLYCGREPALRTASTQAGLERLRAGGYIDAARADALMESYRLLRVVEHRVQMEHERQTHALPEGEALEALAARLGISEDGAALRRMIEGMMRDNAAALDRRLGRAGRETPARQLARELLDLRRDDEAAKRALGAWGFQDPAQALHLVDLARRAPTSPLSPRRPFGDLGLDLLHGTLRAPHPERALTHLAAAMTRLTRRPQYLRSLAEAPLLRRLLLHVFSTSDFLSEALLHDPRLIDDLYDPLTPPEGLKAALARVEAIEDEEAQLDAWARLKARETLRVGLRHLAGQLDGRGIEARLSEVAEGILVGLLERARRALEHPAIEGLGCCALAFGKLGGGELSYGSDLDIIFVYEDPPKGAEAEALYRFTRIARRVISRLGLPTRAGPLYAVDTRLRPGGRHGTLVTSARRFEAYHRDDAATWERMALVRARPIGGPPALRAAIEARLTAILYETPPPPTLTEEMRHVRGRMERELAREGGGRYNPKLGRGGLVDLEFIAQRRQLLDGAPRARDTLTTLIHMRHPRAARLADAWRFLKDLEHGLRVARGRAEAELRAQPEALDALARRMGGVGVDAEAGARLLEAYLEETRFVRAQFEAEFGVEGRAREER